VRRHLLTQPRTGARLGRAADGHPISIEVSPAGAFGPQFGELWAKAAVLAPMVADMAKAPAMAMSFILVMVFRWFQRPFCWVSGKPTNARGKSCR